MTRFLATLVLFFFSSTAFLSAQVKVAYVENRGNAATLVDNSPAKTTVEVGDVFHNFRVTVVTPNYLILTYTDTSANKTHLVLPLRQGYFFKNAAPGLAPPPIQPTDSPTPISPYREKEAPDAQGPISPYPSEQPQTGPLSGPVTLQQTVDRKTFNNELSNLEQLSKDVQVRPEGQDVVLTHITKGSYFDRIGLRSGDRILTVDGKSVNTIDSAADVYISLGQKKSVVVKLLRQSVPTTIVYTFTP